MLLSICYSSKVWRFRWWFAVAPYSFKNCIWHFQLKEFSCCQVISARLFTAYVIVTIMVFVYKTMFIKSHIILVGRFIWYCDSTSSLMSNSSSTESYEVWRRNTDVCRRLIAHWLLAFFTVGKHWDLFVSRCFSERVIHSLCDC